MTKTFETFVYSFIIGNSFWLPEGRFEPFFSVNVSGLSPWHSLLLIEI